MKGILYVCDSCSQDTRNVPQQGFSEIKSYSQGPRLQARTEKAVLGMDENSQYLEGNFREHGARHEDQEASTSYSGARSSERSSRPSSGQPYFNRAISASIKRRSGEGQVIQVTSSKSSDAVERVLPCAHGNSMFVTLANGAVGVWDMATGGHLRDLEITDHVSSDDAVSAIEWSPNCTQLAVVSKRGYVSIWDVDQGSIVCEFLLAAVEDVKSASWSPDGNSLAVCSSGAVIVFDVAKVAQIERYVSDYGRLDQVRWSPCGEKLAALSCEYGIVIWQAGKSECFFSRLEFESESSMTSFCWSSDSMKIAGTFRGSSECSQTLNLEDNLDLELTCSVSLNNLRLSGNLSDVDVISLSDTLGFNVCGAVWDVATEGRLLSLYGHSDGAHWVSWSPDGSRLVSGSDDRSVIVWNSDSGEREMVLTSHKAAVVCVEWTSRADTVLTASVDGTVRVYTV